MKNPIGVAEQAIAFLESLEGDEEEQGLQAARNLRSALSKVAANREAALSALQYGLSGKGVLDWQWSETTYATLDALCSEYYEQWANNRGAT